MALGGHQAVHFAKRISTQERRGFSTVTSTPLYCVVAWREGPTPDSTRFDVTATDGAQTWQLSDAGGPPPDHMLATDVAAYMAACKAALCSPQPKEMYDFVVARSAKRLRLEIRWRSPSMSALATIQLDLAPVEATGPVLAGMLDVLCTGYASLKASVDQLTSTNQQLSQQLMETQEQLRRQKEDSTIREEDLYVKFSMLLNSKKGKLRELQEVVSQQGRQILELEERLKQADVRQGASEAEPDTDRSDHDDNYQDQADGTASRQLQQGPGQGQGEEEGGADRMEVDVPMQQQHQHQQQHQQPTLPPPMHADGGTGGMPHAGAPSGAQAGPSLQAALPVMRAGIGGSSQRAFSLLQQSQRAAGVGAAAQAMAGNTHGGAPVSVGAVSSSQGHASQGVPLESDTLPLVQLNTAGQEDYDRMQLEGEAAEAPPSVLQRASLKRPVEVTTSQQQVFDAGTVPLSQQQQQAAPQGLGAASMGRGGGQFPVYDGDTQRIPTSQYPEQFRPQGEQSSGGTGAGGAAGGSGSGRLKAAAGAAAAQGVGGGGGAMGLAMGAAGSQGGARGTGTTVEAVAAAGPTDEDEELDLGL